MEDKTSNYHLSITVKMRFLEAARNAQYNSYSPTLLTATQATLISAAYTSLYVHEDQNYPASWGKKSAPCFLLKG